MSDEQPMGRMDELRQRLAFKGTRSRPKRKTHRRWHIAAASIYVGMAIISRKMGQRGEAARLLSDAARCRRVAAAYPKNLRCGEKFR